MTDSQVMEQGWDVAGVFVGIVHNGMPLNGSFQGSVTSGDMLSPENRLKYPPYFKVVDVYGNINASSSGVGNIRLPFEEETLERLRLEFGDSGIPAMAGFAFCRNGRGTACITGSFQTVVVNGVGYFTEIYIRHPGTGFLFEFEYDDMIGLSKPFNVLPSSPRVTVLQSSMFGLSISTMTSVHSGSRMMESMTIATSSNDLNVLIPMCQVSCPVDVDTETEGWTACRFLPAGQFKMRLALSDWIGGTAEIEITFEKRNESVSQIQIVNDPKLTASSREGLFLQGISSLSRCRSKPQSVLKYSWSVTSLFMVDGVA